MLPVPVPMPLPELPLLWTACPLRVTAGLLLFSNGSLLSPYPVEERDAVVPELPALPEPEPVVLPDPDVLPEAPERLPVVPAPLLPLFESVSTPVPLVVSCIVLPCPSASDGVPLP